MKNIILASGLVALSFALCAQSKVYRDVSASGFKAAMDSLPNAIILDLRTADELKAGIIPDAKQIDYFSKQFEEQIDKLDRSGIYFVYCAGGGRSGEAKDLMKEKGFACVYNLEGGFTAWKKQKMPVTLPHGQ